MQGKIFTGSQRQTKRSQYIARIMMKAPEDESIEEYGSDEAYRENQRPTFNMSPEIIIDERPTKGTLDEVLHEENLGRAKEVLFTLPPKHEMDENPTEHCSMANLLPPTWIQEVFLVVIFNIILPTADTISDLRPYLILVCYATHGVGVLFSSWRTIP